MLYRLKPLYLFFYCISKMNRNAMNIFRKNYELLHNDKNPYDNINQLSILRIQYSALKFIQ